MKDQKETFADVCSEFIGKPYSENGMGPDSYGCLGLCYCFLKRRGKITDESLWEYNGLTLNNYMDAWNKNPKIDTLLLDAFERIGENILIKRKIAGDLLILKSETGSYFPAIYVGNNNFMSSFFGDGVRIFGLINRITVVSVRRL